MRHNFSAERELELSDIEKPTVALCAGCRLRELDQDDVLCPHCWESAAEQLEPGDNS
jgi:hypothetical protein